MTALFTTIMLGAWSKVKSYIPAIGIVLVIAFGASVWLVSTGRQKEKLAQLEATLRTTQKEYKKNADIDALAASDARDRLLKRWSRR